MSGSDLDLSPTVLARVREAADMLEVVGEHVRLRRRGRRWEGLCPFHEEKTPSFSIDPEKGLYYCFGCHKGGDIISFVMGLEGLTFPEAVEQLARRFGVPLPARRPEDRLRRHEADRLGAILEEAQAWFVEQLATPAASGARRELERRGFAPETWSGFEFGFAPDDWRRLLEQLGRRHTDKAMVAAGLAVDPGSGKPPYDRFRRRITFPIRGRDGALVAFGGRIVGEGEPKYLNSPEGPLFEKRSTLFMLDRAWQAIGSSRTAVVVEGYFDCLQLHRVGMTNTVATLGTSLTEQHARLLKGRIRGDGPGERVLICYDADTAGRRAAARAAAVLLAAGIEEVAVVVLPPGQDPDDVVRGGGGEAIRNLVDRPTPLLDFLLSDLPENPAQRRRQAAAHAPLICGARNPATRQSLIEELARLTYLPAREIEELGTQSRRPPASQSTDANANRQVPVGERALVRALLEWSPQQRRSVLEAVLPELVQDTRVRRVLEAARALADQDTPPSEHARALLERCDDPDITLLVAEVSNTRQHELAGDELRREIDAWAKKRDRYVDRRLASEIHEAEQQGDLERVTQLQQRLLRRRRES